MAESWRTTFVTLPVRYTASNPSYYWAACPEHGMVFMATEDTGVTPPLEVSHICTTRTYEKED